MQKFVERINLSDIKNPLEIGGRKRNGMERKNGLQTDEKAQRSEEESTVLLYFLKTCGEKSSFDLSFIIL